MHSCELFSLLDFFLFPLFAPVLTQLQPKNSNITGFFLFVCFFTYSMYIWAISDILTFFCLSLQVFLEVRPPGPAHEEAHLRAKKQKEWERGRSKRRKRRRRDRK